jgi:hypothetical protein
MAVQLLRHHSDPGSLCKLGSNIIIWTCFEGTFHRFNEVEMKKEVFYWNERVLKS